MENKLVSALSRRSSVRRFAEQTGRGEIPYDIAPLLAALHPEAQRSWREQVVAAQLLGELPLSPVEQQRAAEVLGAIITESRSRPNAKGRTRRWLERSALLSLMVTAGFASAALPSLPESDLWLLVVRMLLNFGGCFALLSPLVWLFSEMVEDLRFCRIRATAIRALGRLHIPELAGMPAYALHDAQSIRRRLGSTQVRHAATEALPPMLERLTPAHYGHLDRDVVPGLCRALEYADERLTLALLQALEKVGDGRAVKSVESLTGDSFTAVLRATPTVRAEATRILPTLLARHEQENAGKVLLRASGIASIAPDMLLRPATNNHAADPQMLLRPGIVRGE